VLTGRATSVPFTAVMTSPERTATGQHQNDVDLRRSLPLQVTVPPDLALGAGGRFSRGLHQPYRARAALRAGPGFEYPRDLARSRASIRAWPFVQLQRKAGECLVSSAAKLGRLLVALEVRDAAEPCSVDRREDDRLSRIDEVGVA
jgi:hypothetical protein